jgi:uncharacterized protein YciI
MTRAEVEYRLAWLKQHRDRLKQHRDREQSGLGEVADDG